MIHPTLIKAKVSVAELSRATHYPRATLTNWLRGNNPRSRLDHAYFLGVLDALDRAVERDEFPLPRSISTAERDRKLRSLLRRNIDLQHLHERAAG